MHAYSWSSADEGQENIVNKLDVSVLRLHFTIESAKEVGRIARAYVKSFCYGETVDSPVSDFTRGHFKRGVE